MPWYSHTPKSDLAKLSLTLGVAFSLLSQTGLTALAAAQAANSATPPSSQDPHGLKPQAPRLAPSASAPATTAPAATNMPPAAPSIEKYVEVAELEKLIFGVSQPAIPIEYRLDRLESEVFHSTNPEWQEGQRIARLKQTLLGGGGAGLPSGGIQGGAPAGTPANPQSYVPNVFSDQPQQLDATQAAAATYLNPVDINSKRFQEQIPRSELELFALEEINDMRLQQGLPPLKWDKLAHTVANELVVDLCKHSTVSHQNSNGDNPDVRYTKAGGCDCLLESLVTLKTKDRPTPNRALVHQMLSELVSHQDDRDALLSTHATNFAFSFDWSASHDKVIACAEVVTKQAELSPIPAEVKVGEKLDIKGVITGPYQFQKITVAWEGFTPPSEGSEAEEASPYFPPLDYQAFARKTERDWQKAAHLLQLGGIGLAIAGGMFIPPVALAAPLIASTSVGSTPKPISEIPVRGGVKVDGATFEHKTPISKDNKEGIYYVTVWAVNENEAAPFAISRRAVLAHNVEEQQPGNKQSDEQSKLAVDKAEKKNKKNERKN